LFFSIIINVWGLFPRVPENEIPAYYMSFRLKFRHVLRIILEFMTAALLATGAVLYGVSDSYAAVPLASIGVVVVFSIMSYVAAASLTYQADSIGHIIFLWQYWT
jgi:hypothetical protein